MRVTILLLALTLLTASSQARTWRVNTAGTGDAPTLYAAMDSAIAGDVVIAEAGEYLLDPAEALVVPAGVELLGESGPAQTRLLRPNWGSYGAVGLGRGSRMSGVHVKASATTLVSNGAGRAVLEDCILEGGGAFVFGGAEASFERCLLIGGGVATPLSYFFSCVVVSNVLYGSGGSRFILCDLVGDVAPEIILSPDDFNFSLDPQFCSPESSNYYLMSTSPCLPANNPYGIPVTIGPLPQGCSTVSVQEKTWGGIKAMYMERR